MKKTILNFLVLITLSVAMVGCEAPSYEGNMQKLLKNDLGNSIQDYDSIVIIPRLGCNSCTHEADKYYQKFKSNGKLLFIFTNLRNLKLLKIENGYDVLERENVMVDSANKYLPLPKFGVISHVRELTPNFGRGTIM